MSITEKENQARERIMQLLDKGSFVEIGQYVSARATDFSIHNQTSIGDGIITGYGVVEGNLVYVYSQDMEVLNGTIGEMNSKKIVNLYNMAIKMGAPIVGFVACGGLRLQEATDSLYGLGSIYRTQVIASGVIPQIIALMGDCGGGVSMVPALADFVYMEQEKANLFVNSPNAVENNFKEKYDTASSDFHAKETGLIDFSGKEEEIIMNIRNLLCMIPSNNEDQTLYEECSDDLNRKCEDIIELYEDLGLLLRSVSDNQIFIETKKEYAKEMKTGFIKLNGLTVGAIGNHTKKYNENGMITEQYDNLLTPGGCRKAAQFVKYCDAFSIPVVSFTDVSGYKADKYTEECLPQVCADLIHTFVQATVPKVNVIIGKALGSAAIALNGKSIGADIVYAWPQAEIGMMEATLAAKIIYHNESEDEIAMGAEQYRSLQSNPVSAAKRGYVDTIIKPEETRKYLIGAFEMLFTKKDGRPTKKHSTV